MLAKHGFSDIVDRVAPTVNKVTRWITFGRFRPRKGDTTPTVVRIKNVIEELGPTFIKFGQILATRPDLVPESLIVELKKLQDDVAPFSQDLMKEHVENELGIKVDDEFSEFHGAPMAAASIAQVHEARLKDGSRVVLKIQRPHIPAIIATDVDILTQLADALEENFPELAQYRPRLIVAEFKKSITKEIDFDREAYNIKRFAANYKGDPRYHTPKVYDQYSNQRILCLEYIDGVNLRSEDLKGHPEFDKTAVVLAATEFILSQTFVHGFFHADPHPGNVFALPGNRLCLIDYGIVGALNQEQIDDLLSYIVFILTKNVDRMIRMYQRLGLIDEHVDLRMLKSDLTDIVERYYEVTLESVDIGIYMAQIFDLVSSHRIHLPAELLLVGKTLATIDGIARDLAPDMDPIKAIRPFLLKIYARRLQDPTFLTRTAVKTAQEFSYALETFPRDFRLIVSKLRKGELTIRHHNEGADQRHKDLMKARNRFAMALAMGMLLLASTAMLLVEAGPLWDDWHASTWVGLLGYGTSIFWGFGFFLGTLRGGGM